MNSTTISWTGATWNPVHGCSRVSAGCDHCYAETISLKFGMTTKPWIGANARENVRLMPHKLMEPYRLKTPSKIFVNSMSDLFHPLVPDDYILRVFAVMADLPQHVFQVLTKRPERAAKWCGPWPHHIWMGTSVEDARVVHRVATLRRCGAPVRFLSCEPLIGPLGDLDLGGIDWVICGGESGRDFRPMGHAWARELRDQCAAAGVAFFFKQSAAFRNESGSALQELDGSRWVYQQFPGDLQPPEQVRQ